MVFLLASGYSGVESVLKLIGLIILCALIIAASYFVTRMIGRREAGMSGNSNFKVIDAYRLTPNKYLQLIQIGSRYICIAVSKDDVTFICELQPEDITVKKNTEKGLSFKEIMAKASGLKLKEKTEDIPDGQSDYDKVGSGGSMNAEEDIKKYKDLKTDDIAKTDDNAKTDGDLNADDM
ncbi:MAG: flagellar biosynthetic protein FliO [Lachnospiraceae bacterium]|nr:flagellar biosynthetic protein FliO [Lachnospiraceae bacterium]